MVEMIILWGNQDSSCRIHSHDVSCVILGLDEKALQEQLSVRLMRFRTMEMSLAESNSCLKLVMNLDFDSVLLKECSSSFDGNSRLVDLSKKRLRLKRLFDQFIFGFTFVVETSTNCFISFREENQRKK